MRVAMVSEFPDDLERPTGGVEAVGACLARGLVARGVDLTVIRFGAESGLRAVVQVGNGASFSIVPVPRRRPATLTNWLLSPFEIGRIIRSIGPDVVHLQGLPELYRGRNVPSVLTVHGVSSRDVLYRGSWLAKPMSWALRATFMESMRHHRHIITISPYVRQELGEHTCICYHDIPNPIEDRFFQVERRPDTNSILYVGMLSRRKNIVGLLDGVACARQTLPGIKLRLAGSWYGNYESHVHEVIRKHELEGSVSFLGPLSREGLLSELARCSCLVLASFQETAPMAIEEAMASGVPVLASRVGGVEWMIRHESTGFLFDPSNPEQLAHLLNRLLSDPSLGARMGEAARIWASQNYRADAVVDRTLAVYDHAINDYTAKHPK
jgi:glycosyltransferase involved in cell wall biosynthesis